MKIITLLTCIFVFSINAIALNIGTTNIVFTYEDTSLTIEQQAIVSNCVDTLLEPALPFSSFSRFQDKVYLEFNIYGYPFNLKMFKKVSIENNTMTLPITKLFSTKILSSEVLRDNPRVFSVILHQNYLSTYVGKCIILHSIE